jgi:hypothetical protein
MVLLMHEEEFCRPLTTLVQIFSRSSSNELYCAKSWKEYIDDPCCENLLMDHVVGIRGENMM